MSCGSPRRGRGPSKSNWNKNFAIRPPGRCLSGWSGSSSLQERGSPEFRALMLYRSTFCSADRSPICLSFPGRAARATGPPARRTGSSPGWRQIVLSDGFSPGHEQVAFDDPRVDPPTMTWAAGRVRGESAMPGWSSLLRFVPSSRLAQRLGCGRREPWRGLAYASCCRPVRFRKRGRSRPSVAPWNEGAAILRGNWHVPQSGVSPLSGRSSRSYAGPGNSDLDPEASDLLADLLGATLVLTPRRNYWSPPAPWLVRAIRYRPGRRPVDPTAPLAAGIGRTAPDQGRRCCPCDGPGPCRPDRSRSRAAVLAGAELVAAGPADRSLDADRRAGGRWPPEREPRFRAWLRGEWTAWARQRYRRVARLAAGGVLPRGQRRHVLLCLETDPEPG